MLIVVMSDRCRAGRHGDRFHCENHGDPRVNPPSHARAPEGSGGNLADGGNVRQIRRR
jgi:hypothetical protein